MRVVRVVFDGEASCSFFFVVDRGWPIAGPFGKIGPAGAARAWIKAQLGGPPTTGSPPEPAAEDVALFRRRWDDAAAGLGLARLHVGRTRARRWVRGPLACDDLAAVDPCWRTAVGRATRLAPRARRHDVAERGGESADLLSCACRLPRRPEPFPSP